MDKIKVMIVDDSAVVRQVLQEVFKSDSDLEVIAAIPDPLFAINRMKSVWPDVIVLDIEMPRMDGITFLKKIMSERPTPVVICSTLTEKGADITMDALAAGAVSIVTKPTIGLKSFLQDSGNNLIKAVKTAFSANMRNVNLPKKRPAMPASARPSIPSPSPATLSKTTERIIAIGTSTGGTQALEYILTELPRSVLGIVIVQHMPEKFTASFAKRLDQNCELTVREACNGDRVLPGFAFIAPGGKHMRLKRSGAQYIVEVFDGPLVNRHRPSVDVLFRSVAKEAGKNALGFILTGMGDDGARGLLEMKNAGARTIGQDEKSCVVYGMPKEAFNIGAVDSVLSLEQVPNEILGFSARP